MFRVLCYSVFSLFLSGLCASAQEFLVDVRRLNEVNNPSELERWIEIVNTPEGRALMSAALLYIGVPPSVVKSASTVGETAANIGLFRTDGAEHVGYIQAPVGYTVCRAFVNQYDPHSADHIGGYGPSLTCENTFNASYRTADDPDSARIDGLHWYMVVNSPGIGAGRCWVDGIVTVAFVQAGKKSMYNCASSGEIAWEYKGGR